MTNQAPNTIYPLSALRAFVLNIQLLTQPNQGSTTPSPEAMVNLVKRLGYVQIDTLNVVNRSHYVTLWARLGNYSIDDFHKLLYKANQRRLYEGWGHAASIISLEDYRYHRWRTNHSAHEWLNKSENRELAAQTLQRIRAEGGLRVSNFEYHGAQRGAWYDWKPPKMALETLFAHGELMVSDRVNFQRVYDLTERVLPEWVDTTPIAPDEGRRFCLEQAAMALGVFEPHHLAWYAHMFSTPARPIIKALVAEGVLTKIQGETINGVKTWLVHRENLPLLQRAADGELKTERTTFLAPFDSLFWAGERDQKLWGFNQLLECYKKPEDRVFGYFCFPILHKDRLVGRFDPRLDRKSGTLHLNALYLDNGIQPDDELVAGIAAAMRDFLSWHNAKELHIQKSNPPWFGEKLMRAL